MHTKSITPVSTIYSPAFQSIPAHLRRLAHPRRPAHPRSPDTPQGATLSPQELRRIVADMVG